MCDYYVDTKGRRYDIMPDNALEYEKLIPHYITFLGWLSDITKEFILIELRNYIQYLEEQLDRKIEYIGVGGKLKDLIKIK